VVINVFKSQKIDGILKNKYAYSLQVTVTFADDETALIEKYKGWNESIQVLSDNNLVTGPQKVSAKSLLVNGHQWSCSDSIYERMTNIPDIIGTDLKRRIGEYRFRERWGVTQVREQITIQT
jgi:hypothetical protein